MCEVREGYLWSVSQGYEQIEFMEGYYYSSVIMSVVVFQVFLKKTEASVSLFDPQQNQWLLSPWQWLFKQHNQSLKQTRMYCNINY